MEKLLGAAKFKLMLKRLTFMASIALSVRHIVSDIVPTAGTDGTSIYYNPEFLKSLDDDELLFLVAHEIMHIGLMHMIRCGKRDQKLYNMAADYAINLLLKDAKLKLIDNILIDEKYRGWTTNEIYDDLEKNNIQLPPDFESDLILVESDGQASRGDQPVPGLNPIGSDSNKTPEQVQKELENKIKATVVKAATESKMQGEYHGRLPGEIQRIIEELINPKLDWTAILHRFLTEKIKDDYTWARPNKRFFPDHYLPSQYSEGICDITIAIDTSGSITDKKLQPMLSEIQYIWETFNPGKLVVIDCDAQIHHVHELTGGLDDPDVLSLKFTGRGGTDFQPVIDYCTEHETKVLIYFTDLFADQIEEDPGFPIIWICYSKHKPAPVGETVYYTPDM